MLAKAKALVLDADNNFGMFGYLDIADLYKVLFGCLVYTLLFPIRIQTMLVQAADSS
jgi:hypothetical protein